MFLRSLFSPVIAALPAAFSGVGRMPALRWIHHSILPTSLDPLTPTNHRKGKSQFEFTSLAPLGGVRFPDPDGALRTPEIGEGGPQPPFSSGQGGSDFGSDRIGPSDSSHRRRVRGLIGNLLPLIVLKPIKRTVPGLIPRRRQIVLTIRPVLTHDGNFLFHIVDKVRAIQKCVLVFGIAGARGQLQAAITK